MSAIHVASNGGNPLPSRVGDGISLSMDCSDASHSGMGIYCTPYFGAMF